MSNSASNGSFNQSHIIHELQTEVALLRRQLARRSALVDAIIAATCWDPAIYEGWADPRWLQIDRDDWADIVRATSFVDSWRPWAVMEPVH
jgi:hypothetical protein